MNDRQREVSQWARAHMEAHDFVICDVETTGLDETAEVVSIAVVNAWGKLAFSSLVKPKCSIDTLSPAFVVNGISNAMVVNAPCPYKIVDVLIHLTAGQTVIAYNSDFDRKMIEQSFDLSLSMECAMLRYSAYYGEPGPYGDWRWQRLENACLQMGIPPRRYHDAASDALATYDLVKALSERLDSFWGVPAVPASEAVKYANKPSTEADFTKVVSDAMNNIPADQVFKFRQGSWVNPEEGMQEYPPDSGL